ncbi:NUDIX domain-containing protein [Clostridiaceae bacterium M8S5]|nr:NUDIX domain-containing protein [Clostridiaceae bacterium M8S5]
MKVGFKEIGHDKTYNLKFAVIMAIHNGKWVFVKHKDRNTWEIPGGHREENEDINTTAKRELYEETGAKEFEITPICDYYVTRDENTSYGRLFTADLNVMGELPNMEIEKIDYFDDLPKEMTYPQIQPYLFERVLEFRQNNK